MRIFNDAIMGASGTPRGPFLMAVGGSAPTGDGVVPAGDMRGLAHAYCGQGVSVQLHTYTGLDHVASIGWFDADARHSCRSATPG